MQKAPSLKPLKPAILRANNGERFDLRYYEVVSLRIPGVIGEEREEVPLLRLRLEVPPWKSINGIQ